jgi:hypothetical protein
MEENQFQSWSVDNFNTFARKISNGEVNSVEDTDFPQVCVNFFMNSQKMDMEEAKSMCYGTVLKTYREKKREEVVPKPYLENLEKTFRREIIIEKKKKKRKKSKSKRNFFAYGVGMRNWNVNPDDAIPSGETETF